MKLKVDRIISIATLLASLTAIALVLKRPAPVAQPQTAAPVAEHTQSTGQKSAQPSQTPPLSSASGTPGTRTPEARQPASEPSSASPSPKAGTQVNSDEISAAVARMLGETAGNAGLSPDSNLGSGAPNIVGAPNIKDQQVTMDGDTVHGKFLTEIAGKEVWVTISGHMGEKDGFATFDPTEFKVGDLDVPVSLVNPALQRKLAEERDRLKVPNSGASQ
jgi:hypothetical protein